MAGIYIHIPFCHSKCAYCDFYSLPLRNENDFVESLENEYKSRIDELEGTINTIYLGGGTPSCLSKNSLERIFRMLPTGANEVTIEVNPEDVTSDFIKWMKNNTTVNRVSMGVQSLNDAELKVIGRRHTSSEAISAADLLLSNNYNISLDLIYGLPLQTIRSWTESLDRIIKLYPQHLSCYLLSYEPGTRLTALKQMGKITEISDETATAMYEILCERTYSAGYEHYEISNFAIPGYQSQHNSSYWNMTPYLGLGPGAHSYSGKLRSYNPGNLSGYIEKKGLGINITEEENDLERFNDFIITSLRTANGLNLEKCEDLFGPDYRASVENAAKKFIYKDIIWQNGVYIGINQRHWLSSDSIMLDFIKI
ncbi:MAG: radical SAM family heme chaperone HemW [Paramuribaculum sp.]|nr:radical SAM family heme chaperone HemW [Paramuribaculum sp.]